MSWALKDVCNLGNKDGRRGMAVKGNSMTKDAGVRTVLASTD